MINKTGFLFTYYHGRSTSDHSEELVLPAAVVFSRNKYNIKKQNKYTLLHNVIFTSNTFVVYFIVYSLKFRKYKGLNGFI